MHISFENSAEADPQHREESLLYKAYKNPYLL